MEAAVVLLAHIDAAHWWGPFGWLYRNTPGNIAASIIWASPVIVTATVHARRYVRRHEELHRKLDHIIAHHPDIPPLGVEGEVLITRAPTEPLRTRGPAMNA